MREKGFTLVEVAVSISLFAVLAYAGTTFFIQAVRDSNRVTIENEVRQTASTIMSDISAEVKGLASKTVSGQFCINQTVSGSKSTLYLSDGVLGASNNCGTSYTRWITYEADSTTGDFTKKINGGTAVPLNSSRARVVKCTTSPKGGGCFTGTCGQGFVISNDVATGVKTVTLTVQQVSSVTRSDFCAKTELSQTLVPRIRP